MNCIKCKYFAFIHREQFNDMGFHYCKLIGGEGASLYSRKVFCDGKYFAPKPKIETNV